jgi:hypothetical protein
VNAHRHTVTALAAPAVLISRHIYATVPSEPVRVAALVEISAAAAALARTVVMLRRLDPELIAPHVFDQADLRAVLGRGRWLPTMCRHVPAYSCDPVPVGTFVPAVLPTRSVPWRASLHYRPAATPAVTAEAPLFALAAGHR